MKLIFNKHCKNACNYKNILLLSMFFVISLSMGCKAKLNPKEWLVKWNNAWLECYNSLPPLKQNNIYIDPYKDLMEQLVFPPIVNRDKEVEELIKSRYPELYSYRGIPEYENMLKEQRNEIPLIIPTPPYNPTPKSHRSVFQIQNDISKCQKDLDDCVRNQANAESSGSVVVAASYNGLIEQANQRLEALQMELINAQ